MSLCKIFYDDYLDHQDLIKLYNLKSKDFKSLSYELDERYDYIYIPNFNANINSSNIAQLDEILEKLESEEINFSIFIFDRIVSLITECKQILSDIEALEIKKLGLGNFGVVFLYKNKYAVKILNDNNLLSHIREIDALRRLIGISGVLQLIDVCHFQDDESSITIMITPRLKNYRFKKTMKRAKNKQSFDSGSKP